MSEQEEKIRLALDELSKIGQELEAERVRYESENDTWWNGLSEKEREDAFYAVCKRIFDGDIKQNGSYRYVLYDVFGFDPGMYGRGMDCGYMAIHNALADGQRYKELEEVDQIKTNE
jgi:hypothetical protein